LGSLCSSQAALAVLGEDVTSSHSPTSHFLLLCNVKSQNNHVQKNLEVFWFLEQFKAKADPVPRQRHQVQLQCNADLSEIFTVSVIEVKQLYSTLSIIHFAV
jgi:hypothetical protein